MELVKLGQGNIWQYIRLKVSPAQEDFVASNDLSLIEAFAVREDGYTALPFGLAENGEPVGFLMIGCGSIGDADEPAWVQDSYCIWRLMIDRRFQGRGLGKAALAAALAYIRTFPCGRAERCWLSYEPENAAARALYRSFGFRETGEMDGDEVIAVLPL